MDEQWKENGEQPEVNYAATEQGTQPAEPAYTSTETYSAPVQPDNQQPVYQQPVYQQNTYQQNAYTQNSRPVNNANDGKDGLCMASLILGIIGFFINPLYILSILAIVFGIIGMNSTSANADKAKVGLILGIASLCLQFIVDLLLTIFTFGMGGVSFCC